VTYKIQILGPAKRGFKNLPKSEQAIARELIGSLRDDPRPHGCDHVMGHNNTFRVKKQNVRVIYGIFDEIKHVFIVAVRKRNEATYKNIPTEALNLALSQAIASLKAKPIDC
jgi:mRNA-degrading endonuclease RelE of RelBE toxin-antitoxin system